MLGKLQWIHLSLQEGTALMYEAFESVTLKRIARNLYETEMKKQNLFFP
jgi:hypothetical protein